ncbi:DUF883 family protein [Litorimonas sp. WD9-15]|uniref:DUF883 family protein n=1 Tax=Litorimonas sp. WD9-15 TaxID=3418716 RepID=UPI003D090373
MPAKKTATPIETDLSAQIEVLRADVALLTKTLKEQTKVTVTEKAESAKAMAHERVDLAKAKYDDLSSQAEASIKENPLASVAIAVGAGMVLGLLTRR